MNLLKKILFRGGGKSVPTSVLVPLKVTNFFVNEIIKSKIGFDRLFITGLFCGTI